MQVEFTSTIDRSTFQYDNAASSLGDFRNALTWARLLERHNFNRLQIPNCQGRQSESQFAAFLLHNTTSLSIALPHRAGPVAPALAAEQLAALDQLSAGRLLIRLVNASGADLAIGEHAADLARTDEYLVLVKRLWANGAPFDHEGPFYSVRQGSVSSRPFSETGIRFILGGVSGTAVIEAARHADVFALPNGSTEDVRRTISRVQAAAQTVGRASKIRFSLDITPIVAASQNEAERRAGSLGAKSADVLAGTADHIAVALLRFCELGVSEFVIHGLETPEDIACFGEDVIPLVRRSLDRGKAAGSARHFLSGAGTPYTRSAFELYASQFDPGWADLRPGSLHALRSEAKRAGRRRSLGVPIA